MRRVLAAACLAGTVAVSRSAHAGVSVLLEQPYGKLNVVAPAGHVAIYLDHVCAENSLRLRACQPGELGVVLSRYDGIGNHDWVAMPLIPYLYAVSSAAEIPESVDKAREYGLREAYRRTYLQALVPDAEVDAKPMKNWYELAGSAYDRTIYGFRVDTTAAQDNALIQEFNDGRNQEEYNGMFRNCADFVRVTINRFYPHAVRRNYIADLGMTSPKSVARGLSHYARKHPETGLTVFVIPQVPGSLPRSHSNTGFMEGLVKRYSLPLLVVNPVIVGAASGVALIAYAGHGRFAMPKDAPELDVRKMPAEFAIASKFPEAAPSLPPLVLATTVTRAPRSTSGSTATVSLVRASSAQ